MDDTKLRWLIGAKIVCCGGLLLFLSGALSLAAVGSFVTGNALPLAGGGVLALVLVAWVLVRGQRRRAMQ